MNHPVETQRTDRAVDFAAWKGLFSAMIGIGGWMLLTNGVETIVRTGDASASALFGLIGAGAITGGAIALALISIGAGVAASTLATDYAVSAMASVTIPGRVMIGAVLIVGVLALRCWSFATGSEIDVWKPEMKAIRQTPV